MSRIYGRLFLPSVIILILLFTGCSQFPAVIKLGAVLGLSGDIAVYGEAQKKGIELAVQEINSSGYLGKGKELKVTILDSGATDEGARTAMTKLIKEEKVVGIIGPTLSSQALVADPVAQENKIPVIAISNTAPKITEMGDFIFRCSLPESTVVANTVNAAIKSLKIKNLGILWGKDDAFTVGSYSAFMDAIRENRLVIVAGEPFVSGDTDFKPQLTKVIAQQPDALIVSAFVKEAALIVTQARSLGFKGTIIGGNGFNSPELIRQAGIAAEGVIVGTAWNMANTAQRNVEFVSAFEKAYGKKPDQFAAQAYTSVWLYANAIRTAGKTQPKAIRDGLAKIQNFDSPLGAFSFTPERQPIHPSAVQIVHNSQFEIMAWIVSN